MKVLLLVLSTLAARVALAADPALTIYNENFAVVRQTVPLDLKAGANAVKFADATAEVEPDSVILRDPAGKMQFKIIEQNYRNDPIDQSLLLSLFEGKTINFAVKEANKPDHVVQGKIIRSGHTKGGGGKGDLEPIIEVNGELQFSLPGEPRFPALADGTILKPTLTWKINSPDPVKFDAELSYITQGFTWKASYNLVAPEKGDTVELVGWITMENTSGKEFTDAKIKLLAGTVKTFEPPQIPQNVGVGVGGGEVTEKAFDDFHLYTLAEPTTLRDQETKQVEFTRAAGVTVTRVYLYDGMEDAQPRADYNVGDSREKDFGTRSNTKVWVMNEFDNSKANHLGIALPKGRMRFYRQDGEQLQFTGENEIEHTPKDERLRLYTGDAFDLVGDRKRTDFKVNERTKVLDESFEIKVRNHKEEAVEIRVREHLYRGANWRIVKSSVPFTKTDAQTMEFRVPLKPDEERAITYEVHYSW